MKTSANRFKRKKENKSFSSLLQRPVEPEGVYFLNNLNAKKSIINRCYIPKFLNKILKQHQKEGKQGQIRRHL